MHGIPVRSTYVNGTINIQTLSHDSRINREIVLKLRFTVNEVVFLHLQMYSYC